MADSGDSHYNKQPGGLILVVDDVSHNLKVLCNILGKRDYRIAVAKSGLQALEMVEKVTPDLILLDVMMPELDGFEVCRRLQQSPSTRDVPVIFLTAKAENENVVQGFEIGAVDYITKPFNATELLVRVQTHLELKQARQELLIKNRELTEAKEKLEQAARTDALTQLANRRGLLERFDVEKNRFERSQRSFSMLMGDIDNFKQINDNHGHNCGDYTLTSISKIMLGLVRKQDTVGRWGGEEFLLLLPETNANGARITAEKIRETIANHPFNYEGLSLSIQITFGICTYGDTCSGDIDDCIRVVDDALYKGKASGKNCVVSA